ncbi:MAG: FAD-dependent oxidoreductase [Syntrophales bacterium]|jgi:glycerol-3-phosphate dehydrogenase|nr:FAD-dependent oxidoreductase [Syntrophales bacterium]
MSQIKTEVLIIGGGIGGAAIARELSKYKVDATLVEKGPDVGQGITKCSSTIMCQGSNVLEFRSEYHNSRLVWAGMTMMEPLCKELDIPLKRIGSLELIKNQEEMRHPEKMMRRFKEYKGKYIPDEVEPLQFIDRDTLRSWEPNVNKSYLGALYDPNIAVNDPVRLTIALADNARKNGIKVLLDTEVMSISKGTDEFEVCTNNGSIKCRYIINAAGEYVGKIAQMADADDFALYPVKSYQAVLDKKLGGIINHMVLSNENGMVAPTIHGNLFFGISPGTQRLGKAHDHSTDKKLADAALKNAQELVPGISERDITNSFVGFIVFRNFEIGWHECTVGVSRWVPRFINASIGFPGICAAPAVAKEMIDILRNQGLQLTENPDFDPYEKSMPDFSELSDEEKRQIIAKDPKYGHVVCRCETVTEGEIVEAIKRGARTLDGVKFRCRPGMGRCQGGFCGPRVTKILARELGISEEEVTKKGGESRNLLYKSKELLEAQQ